MTAYYNEINKHAAEWLRKLIANGQIAPGDVDERSIEDVRADDLVGYTQCHFFAGIGGWSLALRLANWPDDREVWTGSCPCQPYSVAGRGLADADPRNLWPQFRRLIAERRPPGVFGEQVAGKAGRSWFAGVRGDLEALGYAAGGADLCAAGVSAPHIRQRLYWVAHLDQTGWRDLAQGATGSECDGLRAHGLGGWVGHWDREGKQTRFEDGSTRRSKSGVGLLVDGFPGRMDEVGAYGNAIVPQVAQAFIECVMECQP